jgi:hypothetical protein
MRKKTRLSLAPSRSTFVPHYDFETLLGHLSPDSEGPVDLSSKEGFLTFSDKNGGTATLVTEHDSKPILTVDIVVTDKMREAKCGAGEKCTEKHSWDTLLTGCSCNNHHPDYFSPVTLKIDLCRNPECTEPHIWLLGWCVECNDGTTISVQVRQIEAAVN